MSRLLKFVAVMAVGFGVVTGSTACGPKQPPYRNPRHLAAASAAEQIDTSSDLSGLQQPDIQVAGSTNANPPVEAQQNHLTQSSGGQGSSSDHFASL